MKLCSVPSCSHRHAARGVCHTHYYHLRKTLTDVQARLQDLHPDPVDRFWAQVGEHGEGCWEFTGCRVSDGYGMITWEGRQQPASRVSWLIHHGPIPADQVVRHRCDNPPCIRPDHLLLGTVADNNHDMWERGNPQIPQLKGQEANGAKLSNDEALLVHRRRASGESVQSLADEFNVSTSTIYKIGQGRRWQHLTMAMDA